MANAADREGAFRALFVAGYGAVRRYAFNRGLRSADADDLVAATFEVAWRRLTDVPTEAPIPWLLGVAHNLWRNQLRRERSYRALVARLPAPLPEQPPDLPDIEPGAIREALATLPDDDQELLRLIAWDGLTPLEAAAVLGCSSDAVRTRLHRARDRLAARLELPRARPPWSRSGAVRHEPDEN
jgi:RNA polymerase sigma-70 factor (ECF subfamily)